MCKAYLHLLSVDFFPPADACVQIYYHQVKWQKFCLDLPSQWQLKEHKSGESRPLPYTTNSALADISAPADTSQLCRRYSRSCSHTLYPPSQRLLGQAPVGQERQCQHTTGTFFLCFSQTGLKESTSTSAQAHVPRRRASSLRACSRGPGGPGSNLPTC